MDALVLSALGADPEGGPGVMAVLQETLRTRGYGIHVVDVLTAVVQACRGCGSCGLKTPGRCVLDDDVQAIYRCVVCCDLLVYATPISFGSHRSELKRVLDRFQPLMVPFYVLRDGEMNFRPRYPSRPFLLGLGTLSTPDPEQEEAYRFLISRHASNMATPGCASVVVTSTAPPAMVRGEIESAMGAMRGVA